MEKINLYTVPADSQIERSDVENETIIIHPLVKHYLLERCKDIYPAWKLTFSIEVIALNEFAEYIMKSKNSF